VPAENPGLQRLAGKCGFVEKPATSWMLYPKVYFDSQIYWNERYPLQAFLIFSSRFKVIWPGNHMMLRKREKMLAAFPEIPDMRAVYPSSEPTAWEGEMTEPIRQVTVWSDDVCRIVDRGDGGGFRDLHPHYGKLFRTRTRGSAAVAAPLSSGIGASGRLFPPSGAA
jgi:hypothetical protein